ncbi:MAG: hypothetical protein WCK70_19845 [Chloroflexales bacterium]
MGISSEAVRRLSGEYTETSAVFNLVTQFGGGKTHALTLLYYLAKHDRAAEGWAGAPYPSPSGDTTDARQCRRGCLCRH